MDSEWRQAFNDVLRGMRTGRMTRRSFMRRMGALGVGAAATIALLEVVAARNITYVVWRSEHDGTGTYSRLVDAFNAQNRDHIHVTYVNGPTSAGELYGDYTAMLQPNSGSTDLLSLDITWVIPFAAKGWLYALEQRWPASARAHYVQAPFQAVAYGTHLFAAPYRLDAGMLYYRTDLAASPPSTWQDLATTATRTQAAPGGIDGFVWSGQEDEGLTSLFVEVLASCGGSVLRPGDPYSATVASDAGNQALETMVGWVGTASPKRVLGYSDYDALMRWDGGKAVFLRNWATAYPQAANGSANAVLGRFGAVPLLASAGNGAGGHSCLGGWHVGINAYSHAPDACWEFIRFLMTPASHTRMALEGEILPTALAVYSDASVRAQRPVLAKALPAFQGAVVRPVSALYQQISQTIQHYTAQALAHQRTVSDALASMQRDVRNICDHALPAPDAPKAPILL